MLLVFTRNSYDQKVSAGWSFLNVLLNAASGASWVLIYHGGGVGMGRSIHAGQVVADGSQLAAEKMKRVLTNDPGRGVMRHVNAVHERAWEFAQECGLNILMPPRKGVRT